MSLSGIRSRRSRVLGGSIDLLRIERSHLRWKQHVLSESGTRGGFHLRVRRKTSQT